MEAKLDNLLENMMQEDKAIGASLSDNKLGFCYGTRGKASSNSSGLITTLIDQASKLHPNSPAPCVVVENADTSVLISKYGQLTGALYKSK